LDFKIPASLLRESTNGPVPYFSLTSFAPFIFLATWPSEVFPRRNRHNLTLSYRMVRTAGSGARPTWAGGYSDEDDHYQSPDEVSEDEYSPSKKVS
jgi:hypothetical protein